MLNRLLRFASIVDCKVRRESPKRFLSAASVAREANCDGGRKKRRNRLRHPVQRTQSASRSPVPEVAMTGALHDGLRARELYVETKSLGRIEIRTADQQEAEFRLTQLLVELGIPASRNLDLEGIL